MARITESTSKSDELKLKKLVADEVGKHLKSEVKKQLSQFSNSKEHNDAMIKKIRKSLIDLYKFMWIKKSIWQNEIKG